MCRQRPIRRHGKTVTLVTVKASLNKNVFRLLLKQLTVSTSRIKTGKLFQIHVAECVKPRTAKTVRVLATERSS